MLRRELRKLRRICPVEAFRNKFLLFKLVLKNNISRGKLITTIIIIIIIIIIEIITILLAILIPVVKTVTLGFLHSGPFSFSHYPKQERQTFQIGASYLNRCVLPLRTPLRINRLIIANEAGHTINRMRRNQNLIMFGAEAI